MNHQSTQPSSDKITITLTGHIEIDRDSLLRSIAQLLKDTTPTSSTSISAEQTANEERLAYTVAETAKLIGVSSITVYRLIYIGLLRPNKSLRCKIISRKEIDRFLAHYL
jgi:hypothetical protein